MVYYDVIDDTPVGRVILAATRSGLCRVAFGRAADPRRLRRYLGGVDPARDPGRLTRYRRQIEEYFAGRRNRFDLPLDLSFVSSPFDRTVLRHCARIPFGRTVSYGQLARRAGSPGAARAVGGAMSRNPIPIVIPCHRVVAAGGRLGGFSGGVRHKRALLAREGVSLR